MKSVLPITGALFLAALSLSACAKGPVGNTAVPQPARSVELPRYLGLWYEIARYENRFERGCEGVTARYTLRPDGDVAVENTCRVGAPDGRAKVAKGRAKVVPESDGAKLKVSFFGPFFGDYWVLDRAPDYQWSIVGEPTGRYLWVLTRAPQPSDETRAMLTERVRALGYDLGLVRWTAQAPAD